MRCVLIIRDAFTGNELGTLYSKADFLSRKNLGTKNPRSISRVGIASA